MIDATGTWFAPGPAGAGGLPAIGEDEAGQAHVAYGMPDVLGRDRARYAGKAVAVLGAGHSAIGTLIDLARLKDDAPATEIHWLLRGEAPEKAFGGGANDKLAARGALGAAFAVLVAAGKIRVEKDFPASRTSATTASACASAPARPAAAAPSPSRNWWSPPACGPSSISCARSGSRSIPRSNARRRWRR